MAVSEPLKLGDKLREALADAQRVLESTDLRGKIHLDMQTGNGTAVSDVEASMDRTSADAKKAAEGGAGGATAVGIAEGPLSPTNRLVDAMEKLIRSLQGVPDALDRPGRRKGAASSASDSPSESEGPGYMNPYILSGMVQNPIGTMRGMGTSMLMGGAGMGMKAPAWLSGMLGGSSGEFSVGRALAAETLGGAAEFMAPWAMGAAGVGAAVASFGTVMHFQNEGAQDRIRDSEARISDYRMGNNAGFNWRAAAWQDEFQSRRDIDTPEIKEMIQSSGVGFGPMMSGGGQGLGANGVGGLQGAINTALNVGISNAQMGGLLGAATRSGTLEMNSAHGDRDLGRYLGLIEQWTREAAKTGVSTSETLAAMASDSSAQAASSHGLVTMGAAKTMGALRANLRAVQSSGMVRVGTNMVENALSSPSRSDTQTVLEINSLMTKDGMGMAEDALGPDVVAAMRERGASSTMIAYEAQKTRLGGQYAKAGMIERMMGHTPLIALSALTGIDQAALAKTEVDIQHAGGARALFRAQPGYDLGGHRGEGINGGPGEGITGEVDLARLAHAQVVLSGMMNSSAAALEELSKNMTLWQRHVVNVADKWRMGDNQAAHTPPPFTTHSGDHISMQHPRRDRFFVQDPYQH